MKCIKCKRKIPKVRLKALPDTTVCVKCSNEQKCVGMMVWDKTCSELVIVPAEEAEDLKRYQKQSWSLEQL